MPAISAFYGIVISMYNEKGGRHSVPHVHARYGENEIAVSLDGEILEGSLPPAKLKLLLAWMVIHEDDLKTNWVLLSEGHEIVKVEALK